jgi:ketosteroid isomerase-like protein
MTPDQKLQLARKFLSVLSTPDESTVRSVVADEMVWSFPGSSVISGESHGVAGVMARAKVIAAHKVHVEIGRAVYGYNGVAIFLHNTSSENGRVLDEHLAAVFTFRGDKIERLDTYLSDVPMVEAFFG